MYIYSSTEIQQSSSLCFVISWQWAALISCLARNRGKSQNLFFTRRKYPWYICASSVLSHIAHSSLDTTNTSLHQLRIREDARFRHDYRNTYCTHARTPTTYTYIHNTYLHNTHTHSTGSLHRRGTNESQRSAGELVVLGCMWLCVGCYFCCRNLSQVHHNIDLYRYI